MCSYRVQPSRHAALAAVFSSSLGVGLIFGFEPPLISLVLSRAGASSFAAGAVTAATWIAVILVGPSYPAIISRLGLKTCIVAGICCAAVVLIIMPAWPSLPFWLVLRIMTGGALGLSWIASEVWLNSVSSDDSRGTVMGIYGTAFSAGVMLGPALLEWTGTQGWVPFAAGAVALLLTLAPLAVMRRVTVPVQPFTPMRDLVGIVGRAPVVMLAALIAGLIESAELTLLPLFGMHAGFPERGALLLVTVFMAGNVFLQVPIGLLADRSGRRLMLGICALLSGVGPLLLLPWLATPTLLWPLIFLWGGTLYAFYSQGVALLGQEFPAALLPTANTVFVMVYCLGGAIGPSVGGWMMDVWPGHGLQALLSGAAFLFLGGLSLGGWRRAAAPTHGMSLPPSIDKGA
jgi:MFS family permease